MNIFAIQSRVPLELKHGLCERNTFTKESNWCQNCIVCWNIEETSGRLRSTIGTNTEPLSFILSPRRASHASLVNKNPGIKFFSNSWFLSHPAISPASYWADELWVRNHSLRWWSKNELWHEKKNISPVWIIHMFNIGFVHTLNINEKVRNLYLQYNIDIIGISVIDQIYRYQGMAIVTSWGRLSWFKAWKATNLSTRLGFVPSWRNQCLFLIRLQNFGLRIPD